MRDKITIIMPVYNSEQFLQRAIESFLNQTYKNIELLCVDDASTDNSLSILKSYSLKDNRIKIIEFKENKGQGVARNYALKVASGDYIMFLDSDDSLEPDACELAINQIIKNNNDFVFFNFKASYSDGRVILGDILKPLLNEENNPHINPIVSKANMFHSFYVWIGIYNKGFILDNNILFNNSKLCEDDIFYTKCWLCAKDVSIINKPLYNYHKRENSSSYQASDYNKILEAKKECYVECKKYYQNSYLMLNYVTYYIRSLLYYLKEFSQLDRSIEKDFFHKVQKVFKELDKNESINLIEDDINYIIYKRIKDHSYLYYKLFLLIENIIAIRKYTINKRRTLIIKFFNRTFKIPLCENREVCLTETDYALYLNFHDIYLKLKQKSYKEMYKSAIKMNEDLLVQVKYLKSLIPINTLPPMTGKLRELQLRILDFSKMLCNEFEKNNIEYFLICGSAIGAIRHSGFIPWDDDIDIGMMRKDYLQCEQYCKEHFIEVDISRLKIVNNKFCYAKYDVLKKAFKKYPNKIFYIKCYNVLQIFCGLGLDNFVSLDIFPFDYYRDNYTFEEHSKYLNYIRCKIPQYKNHAGYMNYLNKELATNPNIVDKSNTIYFGIDSMVSFENSATHFYEAGKIFPLVKAKFEDTELYVPKDIDYYIRNEIRDYKNWPNDINMSQHINARLKYIEKSNK